MKKILCSLLAAMLCGFISYSQTVAVHKNSGLFSGTGNEYPESIKCDQSGNVIIGGRFDGTTDLNPGAAAFSKTSAGSGDCYLVKLDQNGTFLWAQTFGGTGLDRINAVTSDANGNVYAAGYFANTVDFDPGPGVNNITTVAGSDFFVSKFDQAGNYQWTKTFGAALSDYAYGVATDNAGNVYIVGEFSSDSLDANPDAGVNMLYNYTITGSYFEGYLIALDSTGSYLWSNTMKGSASDYARGVTVTSNQEIIVGGYFNTSIELDPAGSIATHGSSDAYLAKFNNNGSFAWLKTFGGGGADYVYAISTAGNHVVATGTFTSVVDFDPSLDSLKLYSNGGSDVYVTRLTTSDGLFSWARTFGNYSSELVNGIAVNTLGNIYVTGSYLDSTQLDPSNSAPTVLTYGGRDAYISKFDSSGNFIFGQHIGSNGTDYGRVVAVTPTGDEFWAAGYFLPGSYFYPDPNNITVSLPAGSANDTYIAKYGSCAFPVISTQPVNTGSCVGGDGTFSVNATGSNLTYQWQIGINFGSSWSNLLDTGIYSNTTTSALQLTGAGQNVNNTFYRCIITADCGLSKTSNVGIMFIGSPNTSVNQNVHILSAVQSSATYQWLDCNNGFSPIPFATTQQYIPSQPGDYSVAVTLNGCTDTSTCYNVTTIGLEDITNEQLHVFPIPTASVIDVSMQRTGNYTATIYDLNGKRVMNNSENEFDQFIKIDLSSLEPGTYLLGVKSSDGNEIYSRIIRQ